MTSAGVLVRAATQATKQVWNARASRVAKIFAEMVMRGRAVYIGPEPPQQFNLPLAKPGDVGERLRPARTAKRIRRRTSGSG